MAVQKPVQLLLIRHGQAQSNVSRILTSYPEVRPMPLTARGRREAEAITQAVADVPVAALFASPLLRTQETAALISEALGLPVITDHRIRETDFGKYNNGPSAKFFLRYLRPSWRYTTSEKSGVESLEKVRARLKEFLRDVREKYSGQTVIVVTHSDAIHELLGIINGASRHFGPIPTGSVHQVYLKDTIKLD